MGGEKELIEEVDDGLLLHCVWIDEIKLLLSSNLLGLY